MFFTIREIIDIVVITFALGFIFSGIFRRRPGVDDYIKGRVRRFDLENIKFAALITAPAVILHELGHKFVAMGFGAEAFFNAAYLFLAIGIFLRLINFGFIFFVPAYVSWSGAVTSLQASLIAFAGPAVNLILWIGTMLWLKFGKVNRKWMPAVALTSRINMFLFIFNMLPIPPFDGFHVFSSLFSYIF